MTLNYKLLTPGPLTTSQSVKEAMLVDHCTWDEDYKSVTQKIRRQLLALAEVPEDTYTSVLMQGSGSFCVESVLSSTVGNRDKLLICANGAYGERMAQMAKRHHLPHTLYQLAEDEVPQASVIDRYFQKDADLNMLAMVHSETTSGILNPLTEIAAVIKKHQALFILDAMSSFGGMRIPMTELGVDFLISSANKCIQGVPGFGFIICRREALLKSQGKARTLSLDLYDQHRVMEVDGKWRYTSPTHTVLAFEQALKELTDEGGIAARHQRYQENNDTLRTAMAELGFQPCIKEHQGAFITSFYYPDNPAFDFHTFYAFLKERGYAIYPGKISQVDCFRIGNIGEIYPEDMLRVAALTKEYMEGLK